MKAEEEAEEILIRESGSVSGSGCGYGTRSGAGNGRIILRAEADEEENISRESKILFHSSKNFH